MDVMLVGVMIGLIVVSTALIVMNAMAMLDGRKFLKKLIELDANQSNELLKLQELNNATQKLMPAFEVRLETLEFKVSQALTANSKPFGR